MLSAHGVVPPGVSQPRIKLPSPLGGTCTRWDRRWVRLLAAEVTLGSQEAAQAKQRKHVP